MRSDRGERPVSVVAVPIRRDPARRDEDAAAWAARVRITDRVGWLADGRLGLLLWDADEAAARRFVRSAAPPGVRPAERAGTVLYVHPGPPPAGDRGGGGPRVLPLEALLVRPMPAWKRAIDLAGASAGLLALTPLLLAAAAAVKLSSPGPVLFSQWRTGLGGRPFRLYKFRSMATDAEDRLTELRTRNEQDGPAFKMAEDPRITPLGRWMRKTSLDELPQLWNVLRGEMSLVGPRPLPTEEADACRPWQRRRLAVTPGLTCGWQVQDKRMTIPFAEWVRMDLRYADRRSPRADLSLIARTVAVVLGRGG